MDSVHWRNFAALAKIDRRTICDAYLYIRTVAAISCIHLR